MRQNIASRPCENERRALVGFACVLVLVQAFLAVLAWPLPRAPADTAFAICHAGGEVPADPAGSKPNILCALCAHAIASAALPPADTALGPREAAYAAIHHGELTPIRTAQVPVRAGASRAPPETI